MDKYDELMSTQSLMVIDAKTGDYISLPRNVDELHSKWKISWKGNGAYSGINDDICSQIENEYLSPHFMFAHGDWSKKTNFDGVEWVGYIADDGVVIQGHLMQNNVQNI